MKKLILILILLSNFSCVKWFEVEPQILVTFKDCNSNLLVNQYVEYEDEGTVRATTDKRGQLKINDFGGSFLFISIPSKSFEIRVKTESKLEIKVCN